jgi:CO/xanthine dehydrogenase FAD-binding subunit
LSEALELLSRPNTVPLAGGTKLLAKGTSAEVVDLQSLGLNQIGWDGDRMQAGAMVTLSQLATVVESKAETAGPAMILVPAIRLAGPNTYRNAATLGGVVASRLADSELLAALLVLNAELLLQDQDVLNMSLADYLQKDEIPTSLVIGIGFKWGKGVGHSQRVARTPADDPIVSITGWKPIDGNVRLAATGISDRPMRLSGAEHCLKNDSSEAAVLEAAAFSKNASTHSGDFRGDANYRAEMASVLTRRVARATLGLGSV